MGAFRSPAFAVACLLVVLGCSRRPAMEVAREPDPEPTPAPVPVPPVRKAALLPEPAAPLAPAPKREAPAEAPAPPEEEMPKGDLNHLNLEVMALEMLYQTQITQAQMEHLQKLIPTTSVPMPPPREVAVSPEYARALGSLHAALIDNDDDRIADVSARLEKLREKESPEFDDVEISDGARKRTPEFFRTLSARQVASYITDYADGFPDPMEKILDAFDDVRKLPGREWEEVRDEVAGQVGWLVAGLDTKTEEDVTKKVTDLLNRVHALKDEDYKTKRPELVKEAEGIAGAVGPTDVIRHFVERSLAELLSNPRIGAALEARLKKEK